MLDFYGWLKEFTTIGHSEDWGDVKKSDHRFNDAEYAARGVRSKYIANMKSGKARKRKKGAK